MKTIPGKNSKYFNFTGKYEGLLIWKKTNGDIPKTVY